MKSPRAWILLQSGRRLNLLNPSPFDWEDADLAICLSRTNRWGGHSRWERPLSVAQHSLTVLALRHRRDGPLCATDALRELLHDADEGFLGFDPIARLKPHLGDGYRTISDRLSVRLRSAIACVHGAPRTMLHTSTPIDLLPQAKPFMLPVGHARKSAPR
jgi:hypothetical protein